MYSKTFYHLIYNNERNILYQLTPVPLQYEKIFRLILNISVEGSIQRNLENNYLLLVNYITLKTITLHNILFFFKFVYNEQLKLELKDFQISPLSKS